MKPSRTKPSKMIIGLLDLYEKLLRSLKSYLINFPKLKPCSTQVYARTLFPRTVRMFLMYIVMKHVSQNIKKNARMFGLKNVQMCRTKIAKMYRKNNAFRFLLRNVSHVLNILAKMFLRRTAVL